jgi:ribosome-associated protein
MLDSMSEEGFEDTADFIKLDQFLKMMGAVGTGGQAKVLIQSAAVRVNGTIETRRGRKLRQGDLVDLMGETFTVEMVGADAWA